MTSYEIKPASVRKNGRSYPAVRVIFPDPESRLPYQWRIYFSQRGFAHGKDARAEAAAMIRDGKVDGEGCYRQARAQLGLDAQC